MPDEVKPNVAENSTQDAQLAAESIASGEEKAPTVDVEGDYKAAQKYSVSDVDRTKEGEAAANAATAPKFEVSKQEETTTQAESTSNPADYMNMAKDVGNSANEGATNVSDDLVEEAIKKGQAGK
ncbi:hypothetical protein H6G81_34095 [Scytonema hofmannii FACHB-248]|uniref:Uncharacterized protein n=1 Tax=Scytonema hofmannii FACHB-248 TaxID=1842502 RepID=A0ABR8H0P0_9CYAN|nr:MULTISPECIES: hypothetical protein [Nostocales]MBD2609392.1 hypothetical protein [Scytonema hofmannii FACHB-248]